MSKQIDTTSAAAWLKAVSNPARLRIAFCLLEGERAVAELEKELLIRQPNLSQHLAELRNVKIAVARREAKSVYYRVAEGDAEHFVLSLLESFKGGARRPVPIKSGSKRADKTVNQAAVFAKLPAC